MFYEPRRIPGDTSNYYDDPACNRLLRTYAQGGEQGVLLFPSTTLSCIGYLRQLSGNRLLLLTGDKGDATEEARLPQSAPVVTHHGSISMMVNYHALGAYVRQEGGQVLTSRHRHCHLNVSAFVFGAHRSAHSETCYAYYDTVQTFGPDDFLALCHEHLGDPQAAQRFRQQARNGDA